MPFGFRYAPAMFPRLVSKLLLGLDIFCGAYLDDIIIFTARRNARIASAVLDTAIPSVRPSVRLSVCLSVCLSVRLSVRHTPVLCQNDGT